MCEAQGLMLPIYQMKKSRLRRIKGPRSDSRLRALIPHMEQCMKCISAQYALAGRPDWREWGGQAPQPPHLQLEASGLQLTRLRWGRGAADRWGGNTPARSQGPQRLVLAQRLSNWVTLGGSLQCLVGFEMPPDERGSRDSWGSSRCLGGGSRGPLFCGQAACSGDHGGPLP